MRWVNMAVIAIFVVATLIFAVQNFQSVTVSFLNFSIGVPQALLIAIIYLLGMVTGGSVWALMRRAFEGARSTT
jgi:lipopolysaccharide assembly protein A